MENKLDKTDVAIKKLQDDSLYYGDYGKKYLSNSDIIKLLKDPTQFRKPQLTTKPMVVGSYFHTAMLERHIKMYVHQGKYYCLKRKRKRF